MFIWQREASDKGKHKKPSSYKILNQHNIASTADGRAQTILSFLPGSTSSGHVAIVDKIKMSICNRAYCVSCVLEKKQIGATAEAMSS